MSYQNEDLAYDVERAIALLGDDKMSGGALSLLPAGGNECEAKVATAVKLLREGLRNWKDNL